MLRKIALVTLGVSSIIRGLSYVGPTSPGQSPLQLSFVDQLIPLSWYAIGWIAAGLVALLSVVWRAVEPAAFGLTIGFNLLWAVSFTASWLFLDSPRAYVSAISYATIAVLAFVVGALKDRPEPPAPPEERVCRGPR